MAEKIRQILRYLSYFFISKHYQGHGIHSPFLFSIAKKVIFCKEDKKKYAIINDYVHQLKRNRDELVIIDRGAGSKHLKSKKRRISSIARNGITKKKYGRLISRLVVHLKPINIIELGTSFGVGTIFLYIGKTNESRIFTVEAEESLHKLATEKFKSLTFKSIHAIQGEFDHVLPDLVKNLDSVDLVYVDGNHRKEPTIRYFEWILEKKNDNTVIIFDDINWSSEMKDAWNIIKSNPHVRLSVDLFQLGIVFFRQDLSKEDYVIFY